MVAQLWALVNYLCWSLRAFGAVAHSMYCAGGLLSLAPPCASVAGAPSAASKTAAQFPDGTAGTPSDDAAAIQPQLPKLPQITEEGATNGRATATEEPAPREGLLAGVLGLGPGFDLRSSAVPSQVVVPQSAVETPASFLGLSPQLAGGLVLLNVRLSCAAAAPPAAASAAAAVPPAGDLAQPAAVMPPPPLPLFCRHRHRRCAPPPPLISPHTH